MVCPDPKLDEEAFVSFLEDLGRRLPQRAVLFPTHDEYIWPISRHADRLDPWFIIPFSRWGTMQHLYDKRAQIESAWRCGVDTPKTVFVDSEADLGRAADEIGFPAIFKPVESLAFKLRFRRHVLQIRSRDELSQVYARANDCGTLMMQEVVPGGDDELYTLGSYLDAESRPLAVFTGHKLRQHPPVFGHCRMAVSRWVRASRPPNCSMRATIGGGRNSRSVHSIIAATSCSSRSSPCVDGMNWATTSRSALPVT